MSNRVASINELSNYRDDFIIEGQLSNEGSNSSPNKLYLKQNYSDLMKGNGIGFCDYKWVCQKVYL